MKKRLFINELKKALFNRGMFISMLISIVLIICYSYFHLKLWSVYELPESMKGIYENQVIACPINYWIIYNMSPYGYYLYYLLPFIAVLPYGISFYKDCKTGYIKNILVREKREEYAVIRYISVYVSGGIAAVMPLLFSFIVLLPYVTWQSPNPVKCEIDPDTLERILFSYPVLYVLIYILLWFVMGGILSVISLMISTANQNILTVFLSPFMIMLLIMFIQIRICVRNPFWSGRAYMPYYFLFCNGTGINVITAIGLVIMSISGLIIFARLIRKKEII